MQISYTNKFEREYRKLSIEIKLKVESREKIFRKNPFTPSLKTHKLSGDLKDFWAFSVDFTYRVIFEFVDNDDIFFHSVGDHDIYK